MMNQLELKQDFQSLVILIIHQYQTLSKQSCKFDYNTFFFFSSNPYLFILIVEQNHYMYSYDSQRYFYDG